MSLSKTEDMRRFNITIPTVSKAVQITTSVTANPDSIGDWLSEINPEYSTLVGLTEHHIDPSRADTIQLCVDDRCLIIQLNHLPAIPASLMDFLKHERNDFCIFDKHASEDQESGDVAMRIKNGKHHLDVKAIIQDRLINYGNNKRSLAEAARKVGVQLNSCLNYGAGSLNWASKYIGVSEIRFATIVAYVVWAIGAEDRTANRKYASGLTRPTRKADAAMVVTTLLVLCLATIFIALVA